MRKAWLIVAKEWLEFRGERALMLSSLLPALLFVLLPLGIMYGIGGAAPDPDTAKLGAASVNPTLANLSPQELGQALIGQQFGVLLLLSSVIIPSVLASYSIVGEKTRRTLEPLLATPIRTWELLLGKMLASLLPAVVVTWVCGALFAVGIAFVAVSGRVFGAIVSPGWLLMLLFCAPLLALIAIAGMVAISARVNDPRTAQQLSAVLIVPVMGIFFGQLAGVLVLSPTLVVGVAALLALLAAGALWGATRLFQRETILTRWT